MSRKPTLISTIISPITLRLTLQMIWAAVTKLLCAAAALNNVSSPRRCVMLGFLFLPLAVDDALKCAVCPFGMQHVAPRTLRDAPSQFNHACNKGNQWKTIHTPASAADVGGAVGGGGGAGGTPERHKCHSEAALRGAAQLGGDEAVSAPRTCGSLWELSQSGSLHRRLFKPKDLQAIQLSPRSWPSRPFCFNPSEGPGHQADGSHASFANNGVVTLFGRLTQPS